MKIIFFLTVFIVLYVGFSNSCSMLTHIEIATRALSFFSFSGFEKFQKAVMNHPSSYQAGATFPDWGYPRDGFHQASEIAHWPPFYVTAATYFHKKYNSNNDEWTEDAERLASFLMGALTHTNADVAWHSLLNVPEGFIQAMSCFGFNCTYGTAHTVADLGGDTVLAVQNDLSYVLTNWSIPIKDIVEIYKLSGWPNVTELVFAEGMLETFVGTMALRDGGAIILFPDHAEKSAFLVDQFQDYFIGGLDDMAVTSTLCWNFTLQWFMNGPGSNPPICQIMNSSYLPPRNYIPFKSASLQKEREFIKDNIIVENLPSGVTSLSFERTQVKKSISPNHIELPNVSDRNILYSTNNYSYLGYAISTVDLNGDHYDDLIISAPGLSANGVAQSGCVYIIFGSNNQSLLNFADIEAVNNIKLCGNNSHERFGHAVAFLDFNLDGVLDLVVSSPNTNYSLVGYQGKIHIFYGSIQRSQWSVSSIPSITISGSDYSNFGYTIITGDINADNHTDLIIGCPFAGIVTFNITYDEVGYVAVFASSQIHEAGSTLTIDDADLFFNAPRSYEGGVTDHGWWGSSLVYVPPNEKTPYPYLIVGGSGNIRFSESSISEESGTISMYLLDGLHDARPLMVFYGNRFERLGAEIALGQISSLTNDAVLAISMPLTTTTIPQSGKVVLLPFDSILTFIKDYNSSTSWILPFDVLQPYILTEIYGSQVFSRFGGSLNFVNIISSNKSPVESLFVGYPMWTGDFYNEGCVCMWESKSIPKGIVKDPILHADRVFTSAKSSGLTMEKGGRFGSSITFGDINGDGDTDVIIASNRRSLNSYLGGSVEVVFSIVP